MVCRALYGTLIIESQSVTCYVGSHGSTCHPTQLKTPRLICRQSNIVGMASSRTQDLMIDSPTF